MRTNDGLEDRGWTGNHVALAACGQDAGSAAANGASGTFANGPATGGPAAALRDGKRASVYTSLDDKDCKTIEEIEETRDWTSECPAAPGYRLELSSGDLRDDLTIIEGNKRTDLGIPTLVANGAFDSLGPKAEWRGHAGGKPDPLIVRVHVASPEGVSDSGRLAIARLGQEPCLVPIVPPAAGQSDRARAIADGELSNCLSKD